MLDQDVGDGVAELAFGTFLVQALKHHDVLAVLLQPGRQRLRQNGLRRDAHVQADEVSLVIQAARDLAHSDRLEPALPHILLAAPDQLHRRSRDLLGYAHRLRDVVLEGAAPAETTA